MRVNNVMTDDVSIVSPDSTVKETAEIMNDLNVGAVPVCQGKKPVGIITDRDIAIRNTAKNGDVNTPVKQIMSEELISATPEMNAEEAAQLMAKYQIRRLPIVEDDNLVGIVSLGDLAVKSDSDMEAAEALTNISVPSRPKK